LPANLRHGTRSGSDQDIIAQSPLITTSSSPRALGPVVDSTTAIALPIRHGLWNSQLILTVRWVGTVFNANGISMPPRSAFSKIPQRLLPDSTGLIQSCLLLRYPLRFRRYRALNFRGDAVTSIPITSLSAHSPVPFSFAPGAGDCPFTGFGIGLPAILPAPARHFSFPATVSKSPLPRRTLKNIGGIAALAFSGGSYRRKIWSTKSPSATLQIHTGHPDRFLSTRRFLRLEGFYKESNPGSARGVFTSPPTLRAFT